MPERPETFELRAMVVRGARIIWDVPHAVDQARERQVLQFEAERVVRCGVIVKVEVARNGRTRWRVSGSDADSRPVDVVVEPWDQNLRVITVIRTDQ